MPTVRSKKGGKRTFPYTQKGEKAAAGYAQATGGTMSMAPGMGGPPMAPKPKKAAPRRPAKKPAKKPMGMGGMY